MSDNLHTDIRCFVMICWVSFRLRALFFVIIIVVMLNVIMLSVIMMIVIMLSVAGVIGMALGLYSKPFFLCNLRFVPIS